MRAVRVPAAAVPLGRALLTEPPGGSGSITHVKKAEEASGLWKENWTETLALLPQEGDRQIVRFNLVSGGPGKEVQTEDFE